MLDLDQLRRRAALLGLAVRGAFHPRPGELGPAFGQVGPMFRQVGPALGELDSAPGVTEPKTVVLLGFTGSEQWALFEASGEARDGLPHPLDRWSRRVIGALASELGAADFYPSGAPSSPLPFQRMARRCEPVYPSPIGLLIHETYGLWHAYRGGLCLRERIALPSAGHTRAQPEAPCERCPSRPCLSTCPVSAFRNGSLDVESCATHVLSEAGTECREGGCLARRACPVGPEFRYAPTQARFHMSAFLGSAGKKP